MKICLVHEEYPEETNFGGIATYQKQLAKKLVDLGHQVYVIARSLDVDKAYEDDGAQIIRIGQSTMKTLEEYICYRKKVCTILEKLQKEDKIDVIETPEWGAETIFFMKSENRKIPIVTKLHTPLCLWQKYNKNGLGYTVNKTMLEWERFCIENSEKVISCSQLLKANLLLNYNINVKNARVIYNIIDYKQFYCKNIRDDSNIIIYIGSIEQRKGVLVFAEAISKIYNECKNFDAQFVFVGKDTIRNDKGISTIEYIKQIIPQKYHERLIFLGQKKHDELNELMNSANIGVVPSLFDNFPYVAIEEMCTELPIIISDNVGVIEIMPDQSPNIFKSNNSNDLKEKIIWLYHSNQRKKIGKLERKAVEENLDDKVLIPKILEMYHEAINEYGQ